MEEREILSVFVYGYDGCGYHARASAAAKTTFGDENVQVKTFETRDEFRKWLISPDGTKEQLSTFGEKAASHSSSPYVWITEADKTWYVGGCDDLLSLINQLDEEKSATGKYYLPQGFVQMVLKDQALAKFVQTKNLPVVGMKQ